MTTPHLATYTLREGGGLPLVLLHAYPLDHRMWTECAQALPPGIRVLAVDLPGQGHSDLAGRAPTIEAAADAVHATLTAQGEGHAVMAGISLGGYVALALAERHPASVRGLGLVDTRSTADTEEARANRLRIADEAESTQAIDAVLGMPAKLLGETSLKNRRRLFPVLEAWIRAQSPAGIAWAQRAMAARPDRTEVLRGFTYPVAVVVGAEDSITPVPDAEHMAQAAPDSALSVVPETGHLSAVEDPQAVADALALLHGRAAGRH
ncbi:alpha/beta fold hydrolase [Antribacter gilvus]|uniref:alpha/beta fold hydrolase n=1 Tax=Antribacter gilvus TaxID=2304675 RepID=UPI000F7913C1|nr:alpha/beta fold hydrolase [Antribacter gilvus]